jgi:geranylgeranyl reductase family protein
MAGQPIDVLVVGGGPAGAATALALARVDPALASRTLLIDAAEFPRDKTCAGGLIPHTLELLRALDLELDVPFVRVDHARVEAGGSATLEIPSPGCCFVIRRREFDAMLLDAARKRGAAVREGVKVRSVERAAEGFRVATSAGEIRCRAIVGADGAGSLVRRSLVDSDAGFVARAVMCDVPIAEAIVPSTYEFDFRPVFDGLRGYAWAFPCLIGGEPHWNVGVYSLERRGAGGTLDRLLGERVGDRDDCRRRAHPIRLYGPGLPVSAPGVLLVGDAAGVDPLLGEGISYALEYGALAARELAEGFRRGDLGFRGYRRRVRRSGMGSKLTRLGLGARLFYGPRRRFWFGVARASRRAQRIGMNWYNGVGYHGGAGALADLDRHPPKARATTDVRP